MCIEMRQTIDDLTAVCWSRERDCYDRSFRRTRSSICRLGCVHKLFQTFQAFTTVKNVCKLLQRRTRFGNYNMLTKASAYQYIVEKNQDEISRVIARSGLARHFGNIALISDDAVILLLSNLYTESVQKGWREPNLISFALWALFGERVSHPPSRLELAKNVWQANWRDWNATNRDSF